MRSGAGEIFETLRPSSAISACFPLDVPPSDEPASLPSTGYIYGLEFTIRTCLTMDSDGPQLPAASPPIWRWVVGFLLVGAAWGLTTPFMRRAAITRDQKPRPPRPFLTDPTTSWLKRKVWGVIYAVGDLLKNPAYAVPLLLNVTGSVWFFVLVGQAGKYDNTK